jgi:hypothetical protein
MGLFRFRKASADTESSRSSSSWTSRFRAISFSRNNNSINTTPPLECIPVAIGHVNSSLQRANTTSTISQMSSQQPSIAGSRPPSEMFCASPTDTTFTPSFPTRTPSMYSHRSYSIRRDSIRGRPPVLPRPSQTEISHHIPLATSEDGLVLTGTVCFSPIFNIDICLLTICSHDIPRALQQSCIYPKTAHTQLSYNEKKKSVDTS